jgi:hypothetical protein
MKQQEKETTWMNQYATQQALLQALESEVASLTVSTNSGSTGKTAAVGGNEQVSISKNEYDALIQKVNHVEVMVLQQMMSMVNTILQKPSSSSSSSSSSSP